MKVLIVCSKNSGKIAPFIVEQVESLNRIGIETEYFTIEHKGIKGYLKCYYPLLKKIKEFRPDIIHAHYGLSGLLANLQRKVPVVTTYHGSDINNSKVIFFSQLCMKLSKHNIFVSFKNLEKTGLTKNASLIPCGVNTSLFVTSSKEKASKKLGLTSDKKHILFAGAFDDSVKNSGLALEAVSLLENTELLELKGYTRQQVVFLMNAVDVALMTSFTEGSPQFIKEAMACNCPVVSVPVGDVPENIKNLTGCYITTYEPDDVAEKLLSALEFGERTKGRDRIIELGLDIESVANRILGVYEKVKK